MIDYLTTVEIISMHKVLINNYGGLKGIRDIGAIESAIYRPQTGYYSDIIEQAAALMESLADNHPFLDGNKHIAFAAADIFLTINGYAIGIEPIAIHKQIEQMFAQQQFDLSNIDKMLRSLCVKTDA